MCIVLHQLMSSNRVCSSPIIILFGVRRSWTYVAATYHRVIIVLYWYKLQIILFMNETINNVWTNHVLSSFDRAERWIDFNDLVQFEWLLNNKTICF